MLRLVFVFFLVTATGCAKGLYDWGSYNKHLYSYYDNPEALESFRVSLETHLSRMEAQGKHPAPGLYAELGTLYLELGDRLTALRYYQKEYDTWPESQHMMAAIIKRLNTLEQKALQQNEVSNNEESNDESS